MKAVNNNTTIIGSKVLVDLPVYNTFNVPAKVDTGADSSSIWATNIKEHKGSISFTLFDEGSAFYTGQQVISKQFKIRSVKNSFGHAEFRYKVRLSAVLEGKKIKVWFTLANRADNRYPILIGRRTLSNKFVVDVSKASIAAAKNKEPQVLVLVNSGGSTIRNFYKTMNVENSDKFLATIEKYRDLVFFIEKNKLNILVRGSINEKKLDEFDIVYFKTSTKNSQLAAAVASLAKSMNRPFFDQAAINQPAQSKLLQSIKLAKVGVNVPDTIFMSAHKLATAYLEISSKLGENFVLKDNYGRKGRNRFVIKDHKDYDEALAYAAENKIEFVTQRFVEHEHFYRVLVLGKRVELVIQKEAKISKTAKPKTTKTKSIPPSKLPTDVAVMCVKAADSLGLQVAGVDIAQDKKTGLWYCFEVNSSPQLVAGAFVDKKRAALAKFLYIQARN